MGKKWMYVCSAACFLTAGGAVSAMADTGETALYEMDPVVVTAQRREVKELDVPASTALITSKELRDTGAVSVFDALSRVTGFNSMSWGGGATPDYGMSTSRATIRGFDKGTLVLVNGAPVNLLNYNTAAGIPVDAVEKVEIVKGASSVLYGSEALSGVVNIITKKPGGKTGGTIGTSYGNYLSSWNAGFNAEKVSVYYQRQFIDGISLTSRRGLSSKSGTHSVISPYGLDKGKNDSLFMTAQLTDHLNLNWSYYEQESNRPRYTDYSGKRSILYRYKDIRNNVNLVYDGGDNGWKSVLAYNKRRSHSNKYTYSSGTDDISERYDMYSWTSDTQKQWNFREGRDYLVTGFTFSRENYHGMKSSAAGYYNSTHRNNISLYGSYSYAAAPDFTVILGARGQHSADYAKDKNVFLPQIQTLYKLNAHTSWFINVGKSFQMPAINQYFMKDGTSFNALKPQEGWTYETGLKWIYDAASFKVSIYHMDIQNSFAWKKNPDSTDYLSNAGDFRNTGVEAEYTKKINPFWSWHGGISISNPKDNDDGVWKQDNARLQYTAGVTYEREKWTANVNYLYLGDRQTSYYLINGMVSDIPSYINLSANVQYRPASGQRVTLTLNNITGHINSVNQYENVDLPYNWQVAYSMDF